MKNCYLLQQRPKTIPIMTTQPYLYVTTFWHVLLGTCIVQTTDFKVNIVRRTTFLKAMNNILNPCDDLSFEFLNEFLNFIYICITKEGQLLTLFGITLLCNTTTSKIEKLMVIINRQHDLPSNIFLNINQCNIISGISIYLFIVYINTNSQYSTFFVLHYLDITQKLFILKAYN